MAVLSLHESAVSEWNNLKACSNKGATHQKEAVTLPVPSHTGYTTAPLLITAPLLLAAANHNHNSNAFPAHDELGTCKASLVPPNAINIRCKCHIDFEHSQRQHGRSKWCCAKWNQSCRLEPGHSPAAGCHEGNQSSVEGHLNVAESVPLTEAAPSCRLHTAPFEC